MTDIEIVYGTETGNAELVAFDVADSLGDEFTVGVADLADTDPRTLRRDALYLVVCSSQGEGELPYTAETFADTLRRTDADLGGVHYALFGLGDSTYPCYGCGTDEFDALLRTAGAVRVAPVARHDAGTPDDPSDVAVAWAHDLLAAFPALAA